MREISAADLGLASCQTCGLLSRLGEQESAECPRCRSTIHIRKPNSITRSWAFLLTAYILYVPANVLPIMQTVSLGDMQRDTIMSGITFLWTSGSWDLALIVFIASMVVPIAKMLALTLLLLSVRGGSRFDPLQRARLFRLVEIVGKWSMLDVYVVALLATLVSFNSLMSIVALPGAVAFGAVVVLTMFSAMSFDPRLIWDGQETTANLSTNERNAA